MTNATIYTVKELTDLAASIRKFSNALIPILESALDAQDLEQAAKTIEDMALTFAAGEQPCEECGNALCVEHNRLVNF